ncbi:MAG: hypothetical protein HY245_07760 [Rhizobiales bacterium]|nr:hypothetical protein [Hyphomicrobiales bacterium]
MSLGYGVLLPVLPGIVAQLDTGASRSDAIWHTGLVTAAYTGTALVIALFWGRLSDRLFNSTMIVLPLLLTGAATIAGIFATSLWSLYVVIRLLRQIAPMLVTLAVTALAIGAFEVALVFMPNGQPMSPFEIGVLFAQCTLIMSAAQSVFFLPRFRDGHLRSFVVPALAMLAAGLTASVFAGGIVGHVVSTSLVAIGGGLLPPVLIREISAIDGGASGSANGFQSAASLAGQTAGAILAGSIAAMIGPRWTFVAAAIAVLTTGVVLVRTKKGTAWKGITP